MEKTEIIKYWIDSSDKDYIVMEHLYEKKDYSWSLFIGHLVIEKLLKAIYVKNVDAKSLLSHDLLRIAEKSGVEMNEEQKIFFATVTTFNINARYDDYKQDFNKLCTEEYTNIWISNIKKYREWIKAELLK